MTQAEAESVAAAIAQAALARGYTVHTGLVYGTQEYTVAVESPRSQRILTIITDPAQHTLPEIFDISSYQLHRAEQRLEQLTRRARKLRLDDKIGLEVRGSYDQERRSDITGEVIAVERRHEVMITGQAPCLAGYTFLATVEHLDEGNVVRQVPGACAEGDLLRWREGPATCEHCKLSRVRKDTYLLRKDASGEIFEVGSNCVSQFVGADADLAMKLAQILGLFRDFMRSCGDEDDEDFRSGRAERKFPLDYYLSFVASAIRQRGWVSKTKARDSYGLESTASLAQDAMLHVEKCEDNRCDKIIHLERTDKDYAEADLAIKFIESLAEVEHRSDYLHNLYVACASQALDRRHLGLAASAIIARRSEEERRVEREERERARAEREALFVDEYLPGEIGTRLKGVEVTLLEVKDLESEWGASHLHRFVAAGGYRVAWFASVEQDFEVGETYKVDMTIKKRDDKYGKTVVVTRLSESKVKAKRVKV